MGGAVLGVIIWLGLSWVAAAAFHPHHTAGYLAVIIIPLVVAATIGGVLQDRLSAPRTSAERRRQ